MIFIEVRCDKCGSVGLSRRCFYAHQMRAELKKAGWKHVAEGGKDFCPKCKPRRKLEAERDEPLGALGIIAPDGLGAALSDALGIIALDGLGAALVVCPALLHPEHVIPGLRDVDAHLPGQDDAAVRGGTGEANGIPVDEEPTSAEGL